MSPLRLQIVEGWIRNLADVSDSLRASPSQDVAPRIEISPEARLVAERTLPDIRARLQCLDDVGIGYLTLDRPTRTLSGGEFQRARLAAALSSQLHGVCLVLDEPTAGLHPRDTQRLLKTLHRLRDAGSTVVVVEHDGDIMRAADWLIDLGPGRWCGWRSVIIRRYTGRCETVRPVANRRLPARHVAAGGCHSRGIKNHRAEPHDSQCAA